MWAPIVPVAPTTTACLPARGIMVRADVRCDLDAWWCAVVNLWLWLSLVLDRVSLRMEP